jgi:Transposase DDE domain
VLCGAAGLVSLGTIAIDGTKVAASAALRANRSGDAIRSEMERLRAQVEQIIGEAGRVDAEEDDRFGSARGDELPAELASPLARLNRLERAMDELAELEAAAQAKAAEEAAKIERSAAGGRKRSGAKPSADPFKVLARAEADVKVARERFESARSQWAERRAQAAAQGRKPRGRVPEFAKLDFDLEHAEARLAEARAAAATARPAAPVSQVNVTDPDSRIMKSGRGEWVQAYNAQAAVNDHQIVVGWGLTQSADDHGQFVPLMHATIDALTAAGIRPEIGVFLADAGYWSETNAAAPGPDRLIATLKDWKQRRAARDKGTTNGPPPPGASPVEAMEHRLRTPEGAKTYAKRSFTVEPVFGDSKENRGFSRFMRRGLTAVTSEWSFIATTHNILKLYRSALAPT